MKKEKLLKFFSGQVLTIATLSAVVLGVIVALIVRAASATKWTDREVMYINFIGEIFLRMLKGLTLPLILSSLVSAVGSLDLKLSGKIGTRAVLFYLTTTFLSVVLGIILVVTVQPGVDRSSNPTSGNGSTLVSGKFKNSTTADTLMDLVRNMFPPNILQACLEQVQTSVKAVMQPDNSMEWKISTEWVRGMNIMGLVVCASVCGIAMSTMHGQVNTFLKVVTEFSQLMMKITSWVIWISPIGIFFLILGQILEMDDLNVLAGKLGFYTLTVIFGITFHGFCILPLIYFLLIRKNPYKFIGGLSQALTTAFGTASSSATLPVTIQCLEEKNNVHPYVARFMLPIGATINMDGTALYEAVAAIFIAQLRHIPLTFGSLVAISITATAASIGAAGIPQAGLVTLVMVLDTVGLPPEDISLILAVDWILDRIRTVVNVLGDALGAGIVNEMSRDELAEMSKPEKTDNNGANSIIPAENA